MSKLSFPIRRIEMGLAEELALNISLQRMRFQSVGMAAGAAIWVTLDDRPVW